MRAAWGDPDVGGPLVRAEATARVTGLDEAAALGEQVVSQLRAGGAR